MKLYDTVGAHILADFWGCEFNVLNDAQKLVAELHQAAQAAHMTVLGEEWHQFKPFGCTALLLLAESHISIHTYPERGYAAIDVFTCGGGETAKALEHLEQVLKPLNIRRVNIRRGIPEDAGVVER